MITLVIGVYMKYVARFIGLILGILLILEFLVHIAFLLGAMTQSTTLSLIAVIWLFFVYMVRSMFVVFFAIIVALISHRIHMREMFYSSLLLVIYILLEFFSAFLLWLILPCIILGTLAFSLLGLGIRNWGLRVGEDAFILAGTVMIVGALLFVAGIGGMVIGFSLIIFSNALAYNKDISLNRREAECPR